MKSITEILKQSRKIQPMMFADKLEDLPDALWLEKLQITHTDSEEINRSIIHLVDLQKWRERSDTTTIEISMNTLHWIQYVLEFVLSRQQEIIIDGMPDVKNKEAFEEGYKRITEAYNYIILMVGSIFESFPDFKEKLQFDSDDYTAYKFTIPDALYWILEFSIYCIYRKHKSVENSDPCNTWSKEERKNYANRIRGLLLLKPQLQPWVDKLAAQYPEQRTLNLPIDMLKQSFEFFEDCLKSMEGVG